MPFQSKETAPYTLSSLKPIAYMEEVVIVVGAGMAGPVTAVALKKVGVQVLVLERSEGLWATGAGLVLYPNAWPALDALVVLDELAALYAPFDK